MDIVVLEGIIKHNGTEYGEGEKIEKISKEEAERLETLKVAKIIGESEKEIKGPSRRKKKEDNEES